MTREEIISAANKVIVEHLTGGDPAVLSPEQTFEDLGADSLDMVELTMGFEEKFNIEIGDLEAEGVENIGQAHDLLCKKLGA